jgi:formyl-CoA transferase
MYADAGSSAEGPLAGIRVLDLTIARAGPTCVRQLADMGADVIQVAAPRGEDLGGSDRSNLHRNKRSIVIDLRHEPGREVFYHLARGADVLVENFRPPVKNRLGVDPQSVWRVNPRIVYGSISGFGQDGPYASRPAVDQVAQGYGGLMTVTGPSGGGPWRAGIAISDVGAGTMLTAGILAALVARQRTARGQWVHTSLIETMVSFMDFQAVQWIADGRVPSQSGNDHPTLFPSAGATFPTADGYVNIAALSGFDDFCHLIGAPELAGDEMFSTPSGRRDNELELRQALEAVTRTRTTTEWVDALGGHIPCGPVLSIDQVFADPQIRHLNLTRTVRGPDGAEAEVLRIPITFSDTPAQIHAGVPRAGEHTREILREAGLDEAAIERLIRDGAVLTSNESRGWA